MIKYYNIIYRLYYMSSLSTKSIMLVDDEEEMIILYQQFLRQLGYRVESFKDPVLALDNFKDHSEKYSMVITDFRMPSLSGIELASKMRKMNDNVIINLITAFNVDDGMKNDGNYKLAQIHKIFQKPIRLSELKEEIQSCLEDKEKETKKLS